MSCREFLCLQFSQIPIEEDKIKDNKRENIQDQHCNKAGAENEQDREKQKKIVED